MFRDRQALQMACDMLGLEIVETNKYKWYGRSMGDYPTPNVPGTLGENAEFVIRLTEETKVKLKQQDPYDIGIVSDPVNPGCYVPLYDHYAGGYGLSEVVGEPITNKRGVVQTLCPILKQHYDMCCDALAAREAGDTVEFLTLKAAAVKHPSLFEPNEDEQTWVSIVDADHRIEVTA